MNCWSMALTLATAWTPGHRAQYATQSVWVSKSGMQRQPTAGEEGGYLKNAGPVGCPPGIKQVVLACAHKPASWGGDRELETETRTSQGRGSAPECSETHSPSLLVCNVKKLRAVSQTPDHWLPLSEKSWIWGEGGCLWQEDCCEFEGNPGFQGILSQWLSLFIWQVA